MGAEFKGKGSHVALGPVVGPLGRSPFGGRNWEGFSPDSYLSGVLVEESVAGIQSVGVQACTKHYIGACSPVSSLPNARTSPLICFSERTRNSKEPFCC